MLNGKTAVVTGGSRGIGAAIARKLASKGTDIAIVYSSDDNAASAVCEEIKKDFSVNCRFYRCDVSDFEEAKKAVAAIKNDFGSIYILVNNAGITRDGLSAMMSEEDFRRVIDVNLVGAFNMTRHCIAGFIRQRGGRIINITSISGLMGNAGQANYSASKAGLIGLTKAIARELAPRGITCNAIAPGFILTDMTKDLAQQDEIKSRIPLGSIGSAEDVASAAAYLVEASYVTGEVLRVDGGLAM